MDQTGKGVISVDCSHFVLTNSESSECLSVYYADKTKSAHVGTDQGIESFDLTTGKQLHRFDTKVLSQKFGFDSVDNSVLSLKTDASSNQKLFFTWNNLVCMADLRQKFSPESCPAICQFSKNSVLEYLELINDSVDPYLLVADEDAKNMVLQPVHNSSTSSDPKNVQPLCQYESTSAEIGCSFFKVLSNSCSKLDLLENSFKFMTVKLNGLIEVFTFDNKNVNRLTKSSSQITFDQQKYLQSVDMFKPIFYSSVDVKVNRKKRMTRLYLGMTTGHVLVGNLMKNSFNQIGCFRASSETYQPISHLMALDNDFEFDLYSTNSPQLLTIDCSKYIKLWNIGDAISSGQFSTIATSASYLHQYKINGLTHLNSNKFFLANQHNSVSLLSINRP